MIPGKAGWASDMGSHALGKTLACSALSVRIVPPSLLQFSLSTSKRNAACVMLICLRQQHSTQRTVRLLATLQTDPWRVALY